MESYKVMLNGPAPWGFRLQGGKDFSMPLSVSRLTPGGKAAQAGVGVGDWVLYIDGESTSSMTHIEAQNRIRACGDRLSLTLSSLAASLHLQAMQHHGAVPASCGSPWASAVSLGSWRRGSGTALNKTARPFGAGSPPNPRPGLVTKPVTCAPLGPTCTPQHNGASLRLSGMVVSPVSVLKGPFLHGAEVGGVGTKVVYSISDLTDNSVTCRQPLEPPSTPVYDPEKLRLIEDAADWRPRTGTSQSRSFQKLARLTGTDGMEDHEDELVKKPRQPAQPLEPSSTPVCDPGKLRLIEDAQDWQPRTGTSQSRSFQKLAQLVGTEGTPRTPAATPGPTSRPPWAVDPSFAERYAPDKTSTVVSKHSQPATPTPMQNRSSIVQAAQQGPEASNRTPLCYKCNKVIRGRYLVALGHYYHPEEFTCCQCRKVLDEGGFFEEKGSIFCPKCYDTRYAPSCAKCKKKITGEVMHALKMTWHVQCFMCAACKTPIRNRAFYMEEGQPYCERDYEKMFGTKCRGCDFKIDAGDRFLEALGFSWHDTCFVCAICQTNLEGKTFYSKKDKPLCKSHAFS
ncbi:PDZ and LIM domain protein 7, partial [Dryobates pubescens]